MQNERLALLRKLMQERGIDIYVVPTADFHESEYVGDYFKARKYLTGFTGSAGIAVITQEKAGLWTDGRYFIQAERQLQGSGFELYKMAVKGVPTTEEFIENELPEGGVIGFDGRVVNARLGLKFAAIAEKKAGALYVKEDLVDLCWPNRPPMHKCKAWVLDEEYTGESAADKIARVRAVMDKNAADVYILTSLDDICWLLNVRGNDRSTHFEVMLCYLMMTQKGCVYYCDQDTVPQKVKDYLKQNGVQTAPYSDIYKMADYLGQKSVGRIMMDESKVNYRIFQAVAQSNTVVDLQNPTVKMKACKNAVELENIRNAHIKDGVAMVKWLYWLKQNIGKIPMDEITVADKMAGFRAAQEGFLDLSFDTISAYQENAAMMHYSATPEGKAVLKPEGFLLVDCGGHYLEGSTDITRTVALGPITQKQKDLFTCVLRSNLNLAAAKFLYGCNGNNLDILARGPLWDLGLDYRCGTGHGVGYILNIHEAPNGIRWKIVPERMDSAVLEEGMVTTDEPGVYLEGEFGIRIENEMICRKDEENEYGQFMSFETITLCPIDLDAVDPDAMTRKEKELLNSYHRMVCEKLSPYITAEERSWLREATRAI